MLSGVVLGLLVRQEVQALQEQLRRRCACCERNWGIVAQLDPQTTDMRKSWVKPHGALRRGNRTLVRLHWRKDRPGSATVPEAGKGPVHASPVATAPTAAAGGALEGIPVWIGAYLPSSLLGEGALVSGDPPHMTLLYIDGVKGAEDRAAIMDAVRFVADITAPLRCRVTGHGVLGEGEGVAVALVTAENAAALHANLVSAIANTWRDFERDYDLVPHVALSDAEHEYDLPNGSLWVSGELVVQFGGEDPALVPLRGRQSRLLVRMAKSVGYWAHNSKSGKRYWVPPSGTSLPGDVRRTRANMPQTPEAVQDRFGAEADRFEQRDADGRPLTVRRFGRGRRAAYVTHNETGKHVGTLHVEHGEGGSRVVDAWTHPDHASKPVHVPMLRRLASSHGPVTSPLRMTANLHSAFSAAGASGHSLSIKRDDSGPRYHLEHGAQQSLFKGQQYT